MTLPRLATLCFLALTLVALSAPVSLLVRLRGELP